MNAAIYNAELTEDSCRTWTIGTSPVWRSKGIRKDWWVWKPNTLNYRKVLRVFRRKRVSGATGRPCSKHVLVHFMTEILNFL